MKMPQRNKLDAVDIVVILAFAVMTLVAVAVLTAITISIITAFPWAALGIPLVGLFLYGLVFTRFGEKINDILS